MNTSLDDIAPLPPAGAAALIDAETLADRLQSVGRDTALSDGDAQAAAIEILRAAEAESRAAARARLDAGAGGLHLARALSGYRDMIIRSLSEFAAARIALGHAGIENVAVAAVGGYGRGTLAPLSDVDLLFIVQDTNDPVAAKVIQLVLYALWDCGIVVGHATRTLDECIDLARSDMSIRTAVLEARFLTGDSRLFAILRNRYWSEVAAEVSDFVEAKLAERDARHEREGNSRYRVEPNIKDGKGGLRDLHTLVWIAKYVFRVDQPADLVEAGLLTAQEYNTFRRCTAFLWDVRVHLHMLTGRPEERLTFDMQTAMARRMGYVAPEGGDGALARGVEAFMKTYFLVAREVGQLTGIICTALEMKHAKGTPGQVWARSDAAAPIKDWPQFVMESGRVALSRDTLFADDPANLIRLFAVADATRSYIHPVALRTVARSLYLITEEMRADPAANALFVDILAASNDPERVLRQMNEAGVLGLFIPDFGRVVGMMQFNMYHHFTVDEHLLRAVGELRKILDGSLSADFPLADRIARNIRARRALFVAMFLHDIAKGREEHHSIVGERIARALGPRLGLTAAETDTAAWLIRQHLLLSDTSQRRDIYDPRTAAGVAAEVKTRERLRLLLIMTIADIRAVGPETWNSWKAQLLEELYLEVEVRLGGDDSAGQQRHRIAALMAEGFGPLTGTAVQERAARRFSGGYWLGVPPEYYARHARLMDIAEARHAAGRPILLVDAQREAERDVTAVTVVTADRPGLFAMLAGALALSGAVLVGAKAFTTVNGIALDLFDIQDTDGAAYGGPNRLQRLRERILGLMAGTATLEDVQPRRRMPDREQAFTVPPDVSFDNTASDIHTVVEISHRNRPDLLYRVAAAMRDMGLSIVSAHCTSYGELAVDVFYLKDRGGLKITQPVLLDRIERRVIEVLDAHG